MKFKITQDNLIFIVFIGSLLVVAAGLLINAGKSCDSHISFIVVGDFEELNGTIPELHYNCINMCSEQFDNDYPKLKNCYEQCEVASQDNCDIVPMDGCRGFVNDDE